MSPLITKQPKVESVAVIGAGPGGLAAAKYLVAERSFAKIEVFEQRSSVGGIWNYTPSSIIDDNFTIPRTRPSKLPDLPIPENNVSKSEDEDVEFVSPVYDFLEANIPHTLMNYSDLLFPAGTSLFPKHAVVKKYLERYADDIRPLLRLQTQVLNVVPVSDGLSDRWSIWVCDLKTNERSTSEFDAVVIANGHYSDPYIPDIAGIFEWNEAYPGAISHSKFYRRPEYFLNKKVIVVGNSASGIDLGGQIAPVAQQPLLVSEKEKKPLSPSQNPGSTSVPEIKEFIVEERAVRFIDGRVEKMVDHVIFCTGYLYSFPFLSSINPPLVSNGNSTENLYQHIFYYPRPTMAFIGLPQRIVPFPVSEAQSALIARVFSGRIQLPPVSEMREWEASLVAERGKDKWFHTIAFPLDAQYINYLHDYTMRALPKEGLENDGNGKIPPYWGEEKQWVRERFPLIKAASKKLGNERHGVKYLEDLGFDFKKWKLEMRKGNALL